jgi:hypothetical protein
MLIAADIICDKLLLVMIIYTSNVLFYLQLTKTKAFSRYRILYHILEPILQGHTYS